MALFNILFIFMLFLQLFMFFSKKFAPAKNSKGEIINPEPYAILGNPTYQNFSVEATQIVRFFLTCQFEYLKVSNVKNGIVYIMNNLCVFYTK